MPRTAPLPPITRDQFYESAKPIMVLLGGPTGWPFTLEPKESGSSQSLMWHCQAKSNTRLQLADGTYADLPVTMQFCITVTGSKNLPE